MSETENTDPKKAYGRNQKAGYAFAGAILTAQLGLCFFGKMTGAEFNSGVLMTVVPIVTALSGMSAYIKRKPNAA